MAKPVQCWWSACGGGMLLLAAAAALSCRPAELSGGAADNTLYAETADIKGFDPARSGDVSSSIAIANIYEGLLQYSFLERPYRVIPNLAESLPEVSSNGLVYTFRIRKGIYFQDDPCFSGGRGRELTAQDFIYAFQRLADVKTGSVGFWAVNNRVAGLDEFHDASRAPEPTDYSRPVAGLSAPDSYTLVIRLTEPYPQLLWILAMHYTFAVPREAVEHYGPDFIKHPVGTGPFVLKSFEPNYRIEYVRNPKWRATGRIDRYPDRAAPELAAQGLLKDAGQPLPFLDRIVYYVVNDSSTQWLMFLAGQFEMSGISRDNWDAVLRLDNMITDDMVRQGITLGKAPTLDLFYIGFNMDDPVVGPNRKLRQAMTCAFNSKEWVRFFNDRITRPLGPVPPGVAGYSELPERFPFDLERARQLLAEAGYPGGVNPRTGRRLELTLELGSAENPDFRQSAELFAAFMEKIGIIMKPSYNNWPSFMDKMERRQAQMFSLGWVADYPDAENFLQLFYGANASPGPNHSNYANPEFDRLYEQTRPLPDSPARTALFRRMAEIVVEDCPWIFTQITLSYGLKHRWLHNYAYHAFPYGMMKYRRVDAAARAQWKLGQGREGAR